MEAGLDSLGAVDLRNALVARFGLELPATATFDFPTIAAMAQYIAARMAPSQISEPAWHDSAIVEDAYGPPTKAAVQVVGLACTYPGKLLRASPLRSMVAPNPAAGCKLLLPRDLAGLQIPPCARDIQSPSDTICLVRMAQRHGMPPRPAPILHLRYRHRRGRSAWLLGQGTSQRRPPQHYPARALGH